MRFDLLRSVILGDLASHRSVAAKRSAGSVVHKRTMYVNPRLSRRDVGPPFVCNTGLSLDQPSHDAAIFMVRL